MISSNKASEGSDDSLTGANLQRALSDKEKCKTNYGNAICNMIVYALPTADLGDVLIAPVGVLNKGLTTEC